jgi:prepilin-type N-terminal cleavage/methylation domain-containing protein
MIRKAREGFTILELLIVIAVIAILVGIALPRFKGMRDEGNIARAKGELKSLQTALESYRVRTSAYPTALSNLTTATPNILGSIPNDPFNGANSYGYVVNGDYYAVYSIGPSPSGTVSAINATGTVTESAANVIYMTNGVPLDTTP